MEVTAAEAVAVTSAAADDISAAVFGITVTVTGIMRRSILTRRAAAVLFTHITARGGFAARGGATKNIPRPACCDLELRLAFDDETEVVETRYLCYV